jgi:hypothetical protein
VTSQLVAPELVAVVVAVTGRTPRVLTTSDGETPPRLPAGPMEGPHRSMQAALRARVEQQTGHRLGYVEQLYTFADRDRVNWFGQRVISVCYLALTTPTAPDDLWPDLYRLFPYEDRRRRPLAPDLVDALRAWMGDDEQRSLRVRIDFGLDGRAWLPELALQRYEVLYEAGLVPESPQEATLDAELVGPRMQHDHRRILATGIARVRSKIQYRPVVFELMPEAFTLGWLQECVEAIAGQPVHKQNFRRLMLGQDLVEETGEVTTGTGGRPAKTFRFRRQVLDERSVGGTKLPPLRYRPSPSSGYTRCEHTNATSEHNWRRSPP